MTDVKETHDFRITQEEIICKLNNSKYRNRYKIYNTCLEQNADRWRRNKHRDFEQSLVDGELHCFSYIKFYLDNDKKYALVAGTSGSFTVNRSGSDVKFRVYPAKGEAKEWLYKSKKEWCQTEILIIKTEAKEKKKSKEESNKTEKYLVDCFNLCRS